MTRIAFSIAIAALASTAMGAQASERLAPSFRTIDSGLHTIQLNPRAPLPGEIMVNVNFSIPFMSDERDPVKMATAQAEFRKKLYELVQRECVGLLETIADECRVVSMNVQSNTQPQMLMTTMSANAQYRIIPKMKS